MKKIILASVCLFFISSLSSAQTSKTSAADRKVWLAYMDKIARPVLSNIATEQLKEKMPVVLSKNIDNPQSRTSVSYLEAFGRTLSGISPWLNLEGGTKEEITLRNQYRQWALKGLANSVNPNSKDYLRWDGGQPLVDASFVALALVRCPWLWEQSDKKVQEQVIEAFKKTRNTIPVYTNWILFSGMIEAFFCKYDLGYDKVRVEFAVREFANHWYTGDGLYSDGMNFSFDYYNSIVIHPYLATILEVVNTKQKTYNWYAPKLEKINQRYAEILERLIHTDGSYPASGRSITYRAGVFHHLADISLRKKLPASLKPAQVRGALTAMIKKTLESPSTFTKDGWLTIGLYGAQPSLGEFYITTGSLYICSNVFLPLGLADTDEFWTSAAEPWTSVKIWSGQDVAADHAVEIK
ncbi:DUF2264 domain-containing protein [Paradesertivirga mongoliensis]|uniref:DUF2264 domain-containing protein n=1 Tax=Paradesertivirga mongoliensis TaxID=2100740 RepID=A0ABW4ZLH7_9SPHI|nr:DUF2264 domain-containing protein [Pedobacter mongoliensis]